MTRLQTFLLGIIAVTVVALLVTTVVPGPFRSCQRVDTTPGEPQNWSDLSEGMVTECESTWWPESLFREPIVHPTLRPGQTPGLLQPPPTRRPVPMPTLGPLPTLDRGTFQLPSFAP